MPNQEINATSLDHWDLDHWESRTAAVVAFDNENELGFYNDREVTDSEQLHLFFNRLDLKSTRVRANPHPIHAGLGGLIFKKCTAKSLGTVNFRDFLDLSVYGSAGIPNQAQDRPSHRFYGLKSYTMIAEDKVNTLYPFPGGTWNPDELHKAKARELLPQEVSGPGVDSLDSKLKQWVKQTVGDEKLANKLCVSREHQEQFYHFFTNAQQIAGFCPAATGPTAHTKQALFDMLAHPGYSDIQPALFELFTKKAEIFDFGQSVLAPEDKVLISKEATERAGYFAATQIEIRKLEAFKDGLSKRRLARTLKLGAERLTKVESVDAIINLLKAFSSQCQQTEDVNFMACKNGFSALAMIARGAIYRTPVGHNALGGGEEEELYRLDVLQRELTKNLVNFTGVTLDGDTLRGAVRAVAVLATHLSPYAVGNSWNWHQALKKKDTLKILLIVAICLTPGGALVLALCRCFNRGSNSTSKSQRAIAGIFKSFQKEGAKGQQAADVDVQPVP